ncbi:MAG: glycosyltransferase [archaeon]
MKRPSITTKNRWAQNSLGNTPIFVSANKIDEISDSIIRLLKHHKERKKSAEQVYKKATAERGWNNIVHKHIELYDQIMGRNSRVKMGTACNESNFFGNTRNGVIQ